MFDWFHKKRKTLPATLQVPDGKLLLEVVETAMEAEGIRSLKMRSVDGHKLPSYTAGSHLILELPSGIVRTYSLCGCPDGAREYRLGVLREPRSRGGSLEMHSLRVGDTLVSSPPRNTFELHASRGKTLLLAGGIGITPLISMAYRLRFLGSPFELHYCVRSANRAAFRAELEREFASAVHLHCDDEALEQQFDAQRVLGGRGPGDRLYVCGPPAYIDFVLGFATAAGWPAESMHKEYFGAEVDMKGKAFSVKAVRSGKSIHVAADQSIAGALAAAGVAVPLSCEQGICGTCVTRVLEGCPDHRDTFLTDEEKAANTQITVCCSRSKTDELVLDI